MQRLRTDISFANVVSMIALFVALGGTGYAVSKVDSGDVRNNSLTGKDVKNRSLTGKDVKRNALKGAQVNEASLGKVPSAGSADSAGTAASAGNANTLNGMTAADLAPRAFGFIDENGVLDVGRSKGIAANGVTLGGAGFQYCIELGFTPKVAVAQTETGSSNYIVKSDTEDPDCPPGNDLFFFTVNDAGDGDPTPFNLIVF